MSGTTVVARARDEVEAGIWVDALRAAGVRAAMFEQGASAALGGASLPGWASYPVIVARDDIGRARSVIAEFAGAAVLAPIGDEHAAAKTRRRIMLVAAVIVSAVLVVGLTGRAFG